jgi:hypothetical protein
VGGGLWNLGMWNNQKKKANFVFTNL